MSSTIQKCPKCGGTIIEDLDEPHCLQCGYVDYNILAERDLVEPAALPAAEAAADPGPGQAEARVYANDQPGPADPDDQATQSANGRPPRCKTCKHLAEYGNRYFCESRICPGRLPISIRPEFRKKRQPAAKKTAPAGPDDKPWVAWDRAKKIEVGREAQRSGCYAAAEKFGVPMLTARSWLNSFIHRGEIPPDPRASKSTELRWANAAARAGRAMPAERSAPAAGDPLALLPLPPWRDEWPAVVQVAWLRTLRYLLDERNNTGGND